MALFLSRPKQRGISRRKQGGFINRALIPLLFGGRRWTVQDLFRASEPGVHFETYDPNTLLRRRNRLTYSSQFSNAAWTRSNILSITDNADGVGDLVVPDTTAATHRLLQNAAVIVGNSAVAKVRAKPGGYNWIVINLGNFLGYFNVSAGTVGTVTAGATALIEAATDASGYYDCTVAVPATSVATFVLHATNADATLVFAGDGTSGVYLARAQLEWNTTTASEYQEVTDWNTEYMAAVGAANIGMWEDSAGTIASMVERPVGKWVDWRLGKGASGNHATQATSGSRPTLSARYNLLTKTEQFDDTSAWPATATGTGASPVRTANYATAPDGISMTADRIVLSIGAGTATTDRSGIVQAVTGATIGASYKGRIYLRATDGANVGKVIVARHAAGAGYQSITLTADWQLVEWSEVCATSTIQYSFECRGATGGSAQSADFLIWGADLRTANDAALNIPAYQRVNTAGPTNPDYDTDGFPAFLRFDGTDDSLQTPSIDFSGVDKMTVWVGQTKLSDAAATVLAELTASSTANNGAFGIFAPGSIGAAAYSFASRGTSSASSASAASFPAPASNVLTLLADIAADSLVGRVNGVASASSAADQGSGNYSNAAFNIGRRNNSSLPFNGRLTSLTVRGSTTPTSEGFISQMNRYAARLAGQTNVTA